MYHAPLACLYGCSDEGVVNGDGEEEREWRLPGLLFVDEFISVASRRKT